MKKTKEEAYAEVKRKCKDLRREANEKIGMLPVSSKDDEDWDCHKLHTDGSVRSITDAAQWLLGSQLYNSFMDKVKGPGVYDCYFLIKINKNQSFNKEDHKKSSQLCDELQKQISSEFKRLIAEYEKEYGDDEDDETREDTSTKELH